MRRGLWMIFRWPLLLALLGLFGLLSAPLCASISAGFSRRSVSGVLPRMNTA